MRNTLPAIIVGLIMAILGCRDHQPMPAGSGELARRESPTTQPTEFANPSLGISLSWPPGWKVTSSSEYVLALVNPEGDSISLDVPDLPVHLPGMIPIGLVKNGYLDDLKKKVGGLTVVEESSPEIPQAKARLVRSAWSNGGRSFAEIALLLVHGDRVYILRANSTEAARYEHVRAAFDAVVRSLHWIKHGG